jgi:hypothetical protein
MWTEIVAGRGGLSGGECGAYGIVPDQQHGRGRGRRHLAQARGQLPGGPLARNSSTSAGCKRAVSAGSWRMIMCGDSNPPENRGPAPCRAPARGEGIDGRRVACRDFEHRRASEIGRGGLLQRHGFQVRLDGVAGRFEREFQALDVGGDAGILRRFENSRRRRPVPGPRGGTARQCIRRRYRDRAKACLGPGADRRPGRKHRPSGRWASGGWRSAGWPARFARRPERPAGQTRGGKNLRHSDIIRRYKMRKLAERGGFEPPVELLTLRRFSKPLLSTTQPPLRETVRAESAASLVAAISGPEIIAHTPLAPPTPSRASPVCRRSSRIWRFRLCLPGAAHRQNPYPTTPIPALWTPRRGPQRALWEGS